MDCKINPRNIITNKFFKLLNTQNSSLIKKIGRQKKRFLKFRVLKKASTIKRLNTRKQKIFPNYGITIYL